LIKETLLVMKILYVEDEKLLRRAISHKIESAGYDVFQAADGIEALQAMKENIPDLVLCDDIMPNMTGSELLIEIRNSHPELAEVPFVILSSNSDRSHVLKGFKNGADGYLTKPVDIELMLAKIESMTRLKYRFEKTRNLEKANMYRELKHQSNPEGEFSVLFDNLLERLEREYEGCLKLKETAKKMKAELMVEKELNEGLIDKLNNMESVIDVSLSQLLKIRAKVEETKKYMKSETTYSETLWDQLEEIGRTTEATIIPVAKIAGFRPY